MKEFWKEENLRQHYEIHYDGRQLKLRQHVQRRWSIPVPAILANASNSDTLKQPLYDLPRQRYQLTTLTKNTLKNQKGWIFRT